MDGAAKPRSSRLAALAVGMAAAGSRLLGFARDIGLAMLFGAGPVNDALLIALRLPNLVRRVLGEGGLHTAFVPVLLSLRHNQNSPAENVEARHFAGDVLFALVLLFAGLSILIQLLAVPLVLLLGAPVQSADMAGQWLIMAFPMVAGSGFAAIASALLASRNRFALAAWSGILVNAGVIACLVWLGLHPLPPEQAAGWIAGLSGLSGLVQGLFLLLVVQTSDAAPLWSRPRFSPALARFARLSLPGMLVASSGQLAFLILTHQAGNQSGVVSELYFADRVTQLPFGFIASILAIVVLPLISRDALVKDSGAFNRGIDRAMLVSLALALPAATGLIVLADTISPVLFGHGAFDRAAQQATSSALAGFALSLPALAIGRVAAQGFFAHGRMAEPLAAMLAGLATVILATRWLSQTGHLPDAGDYALAFSAGAIVDMLTGLALLMIRLGWRPQPALVKNILECMAGCTVMAAGLRFAASVTPALMADRSGLVSQILWLLAQCLGGCGLYGLCLTLFGLLKAGRLLPPLVR